MTNNKFDIILLDDHLAIAEGLKISVGQIEGINAVMTFTHPDDAWVYLSDHDVDLVVTDISIKDRSGTDFIRAAREAKHTTKFLVYTMHDDNFMFNQLIELGVDGYVIKGTNLSEVAVAVQTILGGGTYYCAEIQEFIKNRMMKNKVDKKLGLTQREMEVLKLISEEYTTLEMAEKLFLSKSTIETYRNNLIAKLGVKNSVGLIKKAIEYRIIS